jgi:uncharacterized protein
MARLETLLDSLPPPLQPLDVSALDGFLCGVLLQPRAVPAALWLPHVADIDGRPAPAGPALKELQSLVLRRHAELDAAIGARQWFDPWIYELDDDGEAAAAASAGRDAEEDEEEDEEESTGGVRDAVLPWAAGFAAALEAFPALNAMDAPELVEPLALLFMHFDPDDLEDADALAAVIETLEPPADLGEAVQDVVRALMLIADVTRPRAAAPAARRPAAGRRPGAAARGGRPAGPGGMRKPPGRR